MNEVDLLKVLWFVAGGIASTSVYLTCNEHTPQKKKVGATLIPLLIFTAMYVVARAVVVSSPGL